MDLTIQTHLQGLSLRKKRVSISLICALGALASAIAAFEDEEKKQMRKRIRDEIPFYKHIIYSNDTDCHDQIHMTRRAFFQLAELLRKKTSITDTENITLEEQLVMFLHTVGYNLCNCKIGHNFGHSGEIVSRYFHKVLTTILALHADLFLPPHPNTPVEISWKDRFDPYFKDFVGIIDGSHIPVTVDINLQAKCHDRKGNLSQNVMGVCSFDYLFQYVLAGWEGSAADSHVLASALSRSDPLVVPQGKYYLVDAGYPNAPGFLAPYRCTRYHLKKFIRENPINKEKELFNHRHSSLRNTIECTFGILKQSFPLLKHATSYKTATQTKIVLACCILHNFIMREDGLPLEQECEQEDGRDGIDVPLLETYGLNQHDRDDWGMFQDEITRRMWEDYRS